MVIQNHESSSLLFAFFSFSVHSRTSIQKFIQKEMLCLFRALLLWSSRVSQLGPVEEVYDPFHMLGGQPKLLKEQMIE